MADELRTHLANLFLETSSATAARLRQAGFPLTVPLGRLAISRHATGWGVAPRTDDVNVLRDEMILIRAAPLLSGAEISHLHNCAAMLAELAMATLPFATYETRRSSPLIDSDVDFAIPLSSYEDDRVEWIVRAVLIPAIIWHLANLPSLDNASAASAENFAESVVRVAHDDKLRFCTVLPLSGIDLHGLKNDVLVQGNIALRRLEEAEQSEWLERSRALLSPLGTPPEVALEIRTSCQRLKRSLPATRSTADSLLTAFQLHGYALAGGYICDRADPEWLGGSVGTTILLPAASGGSRPLGAEEFKVIVATCGQVGRHKRKTSYSPRILALDRFANGFARREPADALVDFTIVLEALLLPYGPETRRSELSYRFRMHGAHYLASSAQDRPRIVRQLRDIYDIRSRLVHGGNYPGFEELMSCYSDARVLSARGLLRALSEGFPTDSDFTNMVLGMTVSTGQNR